MANRMGYKLAHLDSVRSRGLFLFDQLSPPAQQAAVANIRATEAFHHRAHIQAAADTAKKNIHGVINRQSVPGLIRGARLQKRLMSDAAFCERFILDNLCEFDPTGRYQTHLVQAINPAAAPADTPDPEVAADMDDGPSM